MFSALILILAEQDDRRNMLRVHRRLLRDASDPFEMPEVRFVERFRFSKRVAMALIEEVKPFMKHGERNTFVPLPVKVCSALHFFATGSLKRDIGDDYSAALSKTMVFRAVKELSDILQQFLMIKWIKFPSTATYDDLKLHFYEAHGFSGVIAAIDCTHIRIKKPNKEISHCYLNRKNYYSKNVQLICSDDLIIYGVFARYGGASHDAYIWEASRISAIMEHTYTENSSNQAWIIADSGYPLRPWIMTPYKSATSVAETGYNYKHAQTCNCIERLNGVLKSVFRCLSVGLQTTPSTAGVIINACCVLHNYRRAHGAVDIDTGGFQDDLFDSIGDSEGSSAAYLNEAKLLRNRIAMNLQRNENNN